MKFLRLVPLLGAILLPGAAFAQYPIIFNHIKTTNLTQEECVDNAGAAMRRAGFTKNFEFIGSGAFGVRGRYSASIRCVADRRIVFFAVAGPDNQTASDLVEELQNTF
ncbi:hypothetical protein TUMEXPCC7403_22295 [Tumidithrix helvetica PCC 7403]|uniref:hypothetical protein n=1 Tax=Tumidithrix helvetica TaxID=3457545 RepID=UPI003CAF6D6E